MHETGKPRTNFGENLASKVYQKFNKDGEL